MPPLEPPLEPLHALYGTPATPPVYVALPKASLIVYASADTVVILESPSLRAVRVLVFSDVIPECKDFIRLVCVDPVTCLIAAVVGRDIVIWESSVEDCSLWHVHSTFRHSEDITCVDLQQEHIAIGSSSAIAVLQQDPHPKLGTWKKLWSARTPASRNVAFSPAKTFLASSFTDNTVRLHLTKTHRQLQQIRHPNPVVSLRWRIPPAKHSEELCLCTLSSDSVLRVFAPVIDSPNHLQLAASLDRALFFPELNVDTQGENVTIAAPSKIFWLDKHILTKSPLSTTSLTGPSSVEEGRQRKLRELADEDWELFGAIGSDGSFVVRALTNLDRRPPTLLRQFTILHLPPRTLRPTASTLLLLPPSPSTSTPTLLTSSPLRTHSLDVLSFLDSASNSIIPTRRGQKVVPREEKLIKGYVRTPEGAAIACLRESGGGEVYVWNVLKKGMELRVRGIWDTEGPVAVLNRGKQVAVYANKTLFVHFFILTATQSSSSPYAPSLTLETPYVPSGLPSLHVLPPSSTYSFPTPSHATVLLAITLTSISTFFIVTPPNTPPSLRLYSKTELPPVNGLGSPSLILPVDPMAWSRQPPASSTESHARNPSHFGSVSLSPGSPGLGMSSMIMMPGGVEHDALVSISEEGDLAFWVPERNGHSPDGSMNGLKPGWRCTGSIKTGRRNVRIARCSSAKKTAIVSAIDGREYLSIWDSQESEFSSGLEYHHSFESTATSSSIVGDGKINDLDWTSTEGTDPQAILAVGFKHRVVLLAQQRMTYFDQEDRWAVLGEIDLTRITSKDISDSIWMTGGTLVVGAGHQTFIYGDSSSVSDSSKGPNGSSSSTFFRRIARHTGPLEDYHPQMLLQCLLWNKVELVKNTIVQLSKAVEEAVSSRDGTLVWQPLPVGEYAGYSSSTSAIKVVANGGQRQYSHLFDTDGSDDEDGNIFGRGLVEKLVKRLEESPLTHLTPNEQTHLVVLIKTTLEIDEQRRSLDPNGLRYLISIRSFYLLNSIHDASGTNTPTVTNIVTQIRRHRIRYRDIVWAFFSQSQEILLGASIQACGGKMVWKDARALGVFLWLESSESVKAQAEIIARNQYMTGDDRDPTACSLFYFALGKVKLVHGLWKQAAWHPEQQAMLKFLSNDFTNPRWRTAALKNAFALMSKQRFEYAAAFFMLGGSLKDAVAVCLKQLKDFQLAVALARIVEGEDGPIFKEILTNTAIPIAFQDGNRWLACWAFWKLHRRDLSVRILLTPLKNIANLLESPITDIGNPHYDDPSLALLFVQLKSKTLQTVKGSTEISGRTEFNFVLQIARVFRRMGCHALALDLVLHWSFERVSLQRPRPVSQSIESTVEETSSTPPASRSSIFGDFMQRRASLLIDMDIPTQPATRVPSPALERANTPLVSAQPEQQQDDAKEADLKAQRTGLGNLMKTAKKDVQVPEFDMGAFGF